MKKICVGMALLFFVLFSSSCATSQQGKWLRKAAEQGNAKAQFDLGYKYLRGQGVPQNYAEAVKWYRKAADQGYADAQFNMGLMYKKGYGVPQNYAEAMKWYLKAADQGQVGAQYNLGLMHNFGEGVPKNNAEAAKWYRKAADQGDAGAQFKLGVKYDQGLGVPKDYTEGAKWFRKAADQGNAGAQFFLGVKYDHGLGVPKDSTEAMKWYTKAAEQGNTDARLALGKLLEKTNYPGWKCLEITDTAYFFINKNKIRRQGNLVWYWTMKVPFQKSHSDKKCWKDFWVADCDSYRACIINYNQYDSNGEIIRSHTRKESEIDMSPVVPDSIGEVNLKYACSNAKAGAY